MALINHTKTDDGKYMLEVQISADDFNREIQNAYEKNVGKMNVPGFRKGKAPLPMLEKMYGENLFFDDAIDALLPEEYEKAVGEADIEVIGRPSVDVEAADKQSGVKAKFTVELRPQLTIKKYKGLSAEKASVSVTDEQIDKEIENLRLKDSRMVPVTDRAAAKDDTAIIDFEGFVDGKAFKGGKAENYSLILGSGSFIEGFEDQIIGKNAGDEFDVNVRFPEDYGEKSLAGKDSTFKVKLHEIRTREMPELDDEFAKDVNSDVETLAELRASIKKDLEKAAEDRANEEFENALMDEAAKELEGDIPESMIEDEMDEDVYRFERNLSNQGLRLADYLKYVGSDEEKFRQSFKEKAEKTVKVRLALEAVARAEKIEISDEDAENKYAEMAKEYEMEVDKVKSLVPVKSLKGDMAATRALDFIRDNAKAKAPAKKETAKKESKKADSEAEAK